MNGFRGHSVALALGGGGARGLAHISVLEALDDLGVRPVAIAGTSIGAIVGAAYAAGHGGRALRDHTQALLADRVGLARRLAKSRARRGRLGIAHPVLIDGERFLDAFWPQPMPERFEDLAIPLSVVATDFRRRREAVFTSGPLRPAVAGSMAIPGLVRAAPSPQGFLVDGGLVNPLPYDLLAGKADIVIAVDLSRVCSDGDDGKTAPKPLETIIVASQIMMSAISLRMIADKPPDVLVAPDVAHYLALDLFKAGRIFEAGDACRAGLIASLEQAAERLEARAQARGDGDAQPLWMVARMDLHGTKYLMQDGFASAADAQSFIDAVRRSQLKLHGQDYELYRYTPATRGQRLAELKIMN